MNPYGGSTAARISLPGRICLLIVAANHFSLATAAPAGETVFPGKTWQTRTPAEAGMDVTKLGAIAGGNGCVVRGGRIVFTWGDPSRRADVASACKPVLAHCLLQAIEQQKVANVDEPVVRFEPRLGESNAALGHKDRRITWRRLVNQTSCYGSAEPPGSAYDYNDYNFALLFPYGAFGHGGPRALVVLPSLDVVIAWNDTRIRGDDAENAVLKLLVEACGGTSGPATGIEPSPRSEADPGGASRPAAGADLGQLGSFPKWRRVTVDLAGPESQSRGDPNPFAIAVDGEFTAPSGRRWTVPGYFDGDGSGGPDGRVWRVAFAADETGDWTFRSKSAEPSLDARTARFRVTAVPSDAQGIYRWGRLESVGTAENRIRYLKFRDGPYWLKAGCDDPENFLGKYENYDTPEERAAAIEYLADRGMNSMYILSHNIDGDDKDVWPWLGATAQEAKRNGAGQVRFDIRKLHEWYELFDTMQRRGMVVYLILEDDSAWKGYDHARYYREMVARFGDLPGLVFNLGEEHNENYKLAEGLALAQQLAKIDPYGHPRGIHNVNAPVDAYIDEPALDFTAIQTGAPGSRRGLEHALEHNRIAIDWLRRCASRGKRRLAVHFDEGRPEGERAAWWAAYLGGGGWEAHVLDPHDRPMAAWEKIWNELGGARRFMESLPFWEMEPHNELVRSGHAICLAKPGETYALYLPTGGRVTIDLTPGTNYSVDWWNPANSHDGAFQHHGTLNGARQEITAPAPGDWAVRIVRMNQP